MSAISLGLLLEFKTIFPDEEPLELEDYLRGASKEMVLKIATAFLGFKPHNSVYANNEDLLLMIFSVENHEFANVVYKKIRKLEKDGKKVQIINPFSSLTLFEYFFEKDLQGNNDDKLELERNIFKAYLSLNSKLTAAQDVSISSTKDLDKDWKLLMWIFCSQYPLGDKSNYNIYHIWATQIIKAIYLFEFMEREAKLQPLLRSFLQHFGKTDWRQFLKSLLPLTIPAISDLKETYTEINIDTNNNFEESCAFIEKFMVPPNEELDENDFLSLRAKPFYKIKDGVYRIIFNLFVVEKVFKGLYFLFRGINDELPKGEKVKELKSFFGNEFSEKILLYKILEIIHPRAIHFSGDSLDELKLNAPPDYYIRKNKDILIYESKDFLIRADKKMSFDFNVYQDEFERVLYFEDLEDGTTKNKAIMQLIGNIRKVLEKTFTPDIEYDHREVNIFPVLVYHDHQYDVPGFNFMLNKWFQEELDILKEEGVFTRNVQPLVAINIDNLIYFQVGLQEDISLQELFANYNKFTKIFSGKKYKNEEEKKADLLSKLTPFSIYIHNYFNTHFEHKIPPIMSIVKPSLFPDEDSAQSISNA